MQPHSFKRIILAVILFLAVITLPGLGTGEFIPAVKGAAPPLRVVRTFDNDESGLSNPAGLAFSPRANAFYIVESPKPNGRLAKGTDILQISPFEQQKGIARIAAAVKDPLNITFDSWGNRLLLYQPASRMLVAIPEGAAGQLDPAALTRYNAQHFGLLDPQGMAVDPANGRLFILDRAAQRIVQVEPNADGSFDQAKIATIDLQPTGLAGLSGIAYVPATGHLQLFNPAGQEFIEVTATGQVVTSRGLGLGPIALQGMVAAPSGDPTDDPGNVNLYIVGRDSETNPKLFPSLSVGSSRDSQAPEPAAGRIIEFSLAPLPVRTASVATDQVTLVKTTHTSQFSPPSTDSAGLAYLSNSGTLLMSDSEINEIPLYRGVNLFEMSLSGALINTLDTTTFSDEPTGVAYNPANNHLFFSDDTGSRGVYELAPGPDGHFNTKDDIDTFFTPDASGDSEGVAFDSWQGRIFIADGLAEEVYGIDPGPNGLFEGAGSDDVLSNFDVTSLGIADPEGIEFNPDNGHLYIMASSSDDLIAETTTDGTLIRYLDFSSINADKPAGLAYAPASADPTVKHLYIVDRGVDEDNDGKMYEVSIPPPASTNEPPSISIAAPVEGSAVSSTTLIQIQATDVEDAVGTLTVEWDIDNGSGQPAVYNSSSGYYEADWDTTTSAEGVHTINTRAMDSEGRIVGDSINVIVDNVPDPLISHIGDMDGTSQNAGKNWQAVITLTVHNAGENLVEGATVSGTWSGDASGSGNCTTAVDGTCTVISEDIPKKGSSSTTFTVDTITHGILKYTKDDNHDPDGDSSGTVIQVNRDGSTQNPGNQAPEAAFTYSCSILTCSFDASTSSDADGIIVQYDWDFGEGNPGTGITAGHSYPGAGIYTVVLTVTDDGGASGTSSQQVIVGNTPVMHVGDLDGSTSTGRAGKWQATIMITIHNDGDLPVANATISGSWSAGASGEGSCVTNGIGQCSITKDGIHKNTNSVTFTVDEVVHTSYVYNDGANHDPDGDSSGSAITVLKP